MLCAWLQELYHLYFISADNGPQKKNVVINAYLVPNMYLEFEYTSQT